MAFDEGNVLFVAISDYWRRSVGFKMPTQVKAAEVAEALARELEFD